MTKRESLLREYAVAANKGCQLGTCNQHFAYNFDYATASKDYKISTLEDMVYFQKQANEAKEAEIKAYWESEEGQARQAQYKAFIDTKREEGDIATKAAQYDIMHAIQDTYMSNVEFDRLHLGWHHVSLVLAIGENRIEFDYEAANRHSEEHFTTNIRNAGSFDVFDTSKDSEATYYITIGALLANHKFLAKVKDIIVTLNEYFDNIQDECEEAEQKLLTYQGIHYHK